MATFLLTWNPRRYEWTELEEEIALVKRDGFCPAQWSCGVNKHIAPGNRVFMLRQGQEPRGLMGSGWVTEGSFADTHWEDHPAAHRPPALYVQFDWDVLSATPLIPRARLDEAPFTPMHWNTQTSGIAIAGDVARFLEEEWGRVTGSHFEPLPEEVADARFPEGSYHLVSVNAYERNAQARALCIAHYGYRCFVCGFEFSHTYGPAGRGLIHVHHLTPLSIIKKCYRVDPIKDLRPICPNCHAMSHRRQPPYTLEEVVQMLNTSKH